MPKLPWKMVYLNKKLTDLDKASISVLDRGFLFGDGIYEVVRIYNGEPFLLAEHMQRLQKSLEAIQFPYKDSKGVEKRMRDLISRSKFQEALIYLQISRGTYPFRSHYLPDELAPTEVIMISEYEDPYIESKKVGAKLISHAEMRWRQVNVKSVNLLPNVLAATRARDEKAVEVALVAENGDVTEGSHSNLFAVFSGELWTAPLSPRILPGITRNYVLRLAKEDKIPVVERFFTLERLYQADEVFMTSTTFEIMPISKIDKTEISDGKVGPITQQLQRCFRTS